MPASASTLFAARASFARRLFSLSGVFPLGAFLLLHVFTNSRAVRGEAAFVAATRLYQRIPGLVLVEALFVFVPLLFHTAVGLWLVVARQPLAVPSPYPRGVRVAMRATGVLVVAFLAMHLPELRFRSAGGAHPSGGELLTVLASDMSSTWHGVPWRGIAYLVGIGCVAFHFSAGLWGFFASFPKIGRARVGAAWGAAAVGASIWLLFANVVVLHATGARLFGAPPEPLDEVVAREASDHEACPANSAVPVRPAGEVSQSVKEEGLGPKTPASGGAPAARPDLAVEAGAGTHAQ